jgi:hypothetical protein
VRGEKAFSPDATWTALKSTRSLNKLDLLNKLDRSVGLAGRIPLISRAVLAIVNRWYEGGRPCYMSLNSAQRARMESRVESKLLARGPNPSRKRTIL